jgi:hypothetical protein
LLSPLGIPSRLGSFREQECQQNSTLLVVFLLEGRMTDSVDEQNVRKAWDAMFQLLRVRLDDEQAVQTASARFGPHLVEGQLRNALLFCLLTLPPERRNVDGVQEEFRKSVEKVLRDFQEQGERFFSLSPERGGN